MCAWALASGVPCSVFTEYYNPSSICGWNTSMTPSPSRPPCETTPHRGGALTPAHITHPLTRGDNSHRPWFQHSHGHPMLARPRTIELENSLTNSKTVSIFELENSLTNSKTSLSKQRPPAFLRPPSRLPPGARTSWQPHSISPPVLRRNKKTIKDKK